MQLPDWGFNQLEVATDKITVQDAVVWNVEEHKYTMGKKSVKSQDGMGCASGLGYVKNL
jgi:dolichyl-phosphate-mannose--protein O-mannosyl transferase